MGSAGQHHNPCGLGHGLDHDTPGMTGFLGEMPLEEPVVGRHILDADPLFACLDLNDPVNKQKRITMGQDLPYVIDVKNLCPPFNGRHHPPYFWRWALYFLDQATV